MVASQMMGRLDSLVDLVFERYKDRYFPNEQCFIDIQGDKYFRPPAGASVQGFLGLTELDGREDSALEDIGEAFFARRSRV
jgi:hypothetical protein